MISCQWELLAQPLPGRGDEPYVIGDPAFDGYVRDCATKTVADRLTRRRRRPHPVDDVPVPQLDGRRRRACRRASSTAAIPARVDRLNAIITAIADDRPDVDVLPFGEWVNGRVDDAGDPPRRLALRVPRPQPGRRRLRRVRQRRASSVTTITRSRRSVLALNRRGDRARSVRTVQLAPAAESDGSHPDRSWATARASPLTATLGRGRRRA